MPKNPTSKHKVLIYDIETSPAIGLFFGKPYEVNIAKIIQHEYVFGFAYKWLGERKIYTCYIWDFPLYKKDPTNCIEVIKKWAELASEADVIVGHNSDSFDYKHMFGRLPLYRIPPIRKPQTVDTKKSSKQIGNYQSNKLDDLGSYFGLGRKLPHNLYPNAIDLWWACMEIPGYKKAEEKAQKHMVKYNKQDVRLTEKLYLFERPYMTNHPNMALISDQPDACKVCGENHGFTSAGWKYTTSQKYRYWSCNNCHHKNRGRTSEKLEKPKYV